MVCFQFVHGGFRCGPGFGTEDDTLALVGFWDDMEVDVVHFLVCYAPIVLCQS